MMSIFIPFEALYAESSDFKMKLLGGQKQSSGDSQSPAAEQQKNYGRLPVSSDNEKSKKEKKIQPVRIAPDSGGPRM